MSLLLVVALLIAIAFIVYKQKHPKPSGSNAPKDVSASPEKSHIGSSQTGPPPQDPLSTSKRDAQKMTESENFRQQVASLPVSTPQTPGPPLDVSGSMGSSRGAAPSGAPEKKKSKSKTKTKTKPKKKKSKSKSKAAKLAGRRGAMDSGSEDEAEK
ncbi:unnamed protein product [Heligmosomoides polygyrus]|uniref:Uncharacterized protein n=1 Tax=Heligmosomoides polygyrus TaxID=6339 RepID=A0A183F518_HELPZ|nr:unnamed protein product [Heligmosomoides polygyrus]